MPFKEHLRTVSYEMCCEEFYLNLSPNLMFAKTSTTVSYTLFLCLYIFCSTSFFIVARRIMNDSVLYTVVVSGRCVCVCWLLNASKGTPDSAVVCWRLSVLFPFNNCFRMTRIWKMKARQQLCCFSLTITDVWGKGSESDKTHTALDHQSYTSKKKHVPP